MGHFQAHGRLIVARALVVVALLCSAVVPTEAVAYGGWDFWSAVNQSGNVAQGTGVQTAENAIAAAGVCPYPNNTSWGPCNFGTTTGSCTGGTGRTCTSTAITYADSAATRATGSSFTNSCSQGYVFNNSFTSPACVVGCPDGTQPVGGTCPNVCPAAGTAANSVGTNSIAATTTASIAYNGYQCQISCSGTSVGYRAIVGGHSVSGQVFASCTYTGNSGQAPNATPSTSNCVQGIHGDTMCAGTSGCASFNGEYVCPSTAPAVGSCVTSSHGNMYCTANSYNNGGLASPPGPNNGSAGQLATPDGQMQSNGAGNVVNGYGGGTLAGSTNATPSTGSGVSSSGGVGVGSGSGSGGGSSGSGSGGTVSGGVDCLAAPTITGDPVQAYQATEEWRVYCAYNLGDPAAAQTAITTDVATGLGNPADGSLLKVQDTHDLSTWFSSASAATGGSCPADVPLNFTIGPSAMSINLPLSQFCDRFDTIRLVVLISAALMSLWITMGAFKGE